MLGEEISRVIQEQRALEKKYEQLIEERRNMKGLSNRAKFQANEDEIQRTANALRQSTKILTRNLQDNPNVEGNMHKIQSERSALETLLVNTAHELQFAYAPALAPYPRTDRTRRVPHPVLIGHAASLTPSALAPYPRTLHGAVRRACCKRGLPRSARIGTWCLTPGRLPFRLYAFVRRSFNSLDEVVDKEAKMAAHVQIVLARERELSETVARLRQERRVPHPVLIGHAASLSPYG